MNALLLCFHGRRFIHCVLSRELLDFSVNVFEAKKQTSALLTVSVFLFCFVLFFVYYQTDVFTVFPQLKSNPNM